MEACESIKDDKTIHNGGITEEGETIEGIPNLWDASDVIQTLQYNHPFKQQILNSVIKTLHDLWHCKLDDLPPSLSPTNHEVHPLVARAPLRHRPRHTPRPRRRSCSAA